MSMTLSRKCTASLTVFASLLKSTFLPSSILARLTEPRLHASKGRRGCSPQGFVDSISPTFGVGLSLFILSINTIPGSPFFHEYSTIMSKISRASSCAITSPLRGLIRSYFLPCFTASINFSVIATEILKLLISLSSALQVMNSRISGWSTRRMPILAPRLVPPCFTASVAALNTFIKDTGPEETPLVVFTLSRFGLKRENEKPVPPPLLCMIAADLIASNIPSMESLIGRTKQAASC
ncbi:MAG: hypothetical protein BWY84_01170 [Candidatus Aerophobetes bacterium ADurb.Bin490]|nr:MAG: hypothetical protein BWY84_01170 [Candidatus Aerophobetes bacterium ADurb.Bin490]